MANRAQQDSTLSKVGDLYHYVISLLECFKMGPEDTLRIEVDGDISTISKNGSKQIEVKHHINDSALYNRHIDFWKTLAYWYSDFGRYSNFSVLALHTTSKFGDRSIFKDWDRLHPSERLSSLKSIFDPISDQGDCYELYKKIFIDNYDEEKLLCLLEKVTFRCAQENIVGISSSFDEYLGHIPAENRDAYIAELLGSILLIVSEKPHEWVVTKADFDDLQQKSISNYVNPGTLPLPHEYSNADISELDAEEFKGKVFVRAIEDIDYSNMVIPAIRDYWRTEKTIASYFVNNPLYNKSIDDYKDDLSERLYYEKETVIRGNPDNQDRSNRLAKLLYSKVMNWPVNDFGSIIANRDFFQRGVIHNLVDEEKFVWKITGDDNEH